MDETMMGSVKWFSSGKGFGFLVPDDGDKDIFVHQKNIVMPNTRDFRTLNPDDRVSFKMGEFNGKPQAIEVKRIDE